MNQNLSLASLEESLRAVQNGQDHQKLQKFLITIRKEVDWPKNRDNINNLREEGFLKYVVGALQTSKKCIIDVSLSILGNCCLDNKCSREVVSHYNILPSLNQILKRYPTDNSINGRVFRILGNLCQHRDQWANVVIERKPQIVIHLVKFLSEVAQNEDDGKISEATVNMGLRALREILNRQTLKALVKTYSVLKTVGLLLIKYGMMWQEAKKNENVLVNIVKLLLEYSRYRYYPSIMQMRNTEKGDSIVYLSKILLVAPRQIVKIIMNFLKISQLKSDLPIPEIFNSFVEVLHQNTVEQEFNGTFDECIKCICHLLEHPGNRKNQRCGESIPMLINVLKSLSLQTSNKIECCILIISTLNKCKYNETLILEQIKCNIIDILIEKLTIIVGVLEPFTVPHKNDKKRKNDFFNKFSKMAKRIRTSINEDNEDLVSSSSEGDVDNGGSNSGKYDWVPSPASSSESEMAMSWTSGLSPQSSPRSHLHGLSESDSDDYSPVCSDIETADYDNQDEDLPITEGDKCSDINMEDDDNIPAVKVDSTIMKQIKIRLIMEIVELLKTYSKLRPPILQLGYPQTLLSLVKCSWYIDWPHSTAIFDVLDLMFRILELHIYLLPLMQTTFIPTIYELTVMQHVSCEKCREMYWVSTSIIKRLSKVAESGVGKGDIAHKLLRGDNTISQQIVLVIPYIVKNRSILVKLMLNCGGLEILMKLLREENELKERSIKVLCVLASKKLGIPNPQNVNNSCRIKALKQDSNPSSHIVTFKLDDGSNLRADRSLLSKNSDFFSRLLHGDFKESNEDEIALHNVINKSFKSLLHLIKSDVDKSEPFELDLDLNTHLDVIALCDRFLMTDYCVYLTDCVEKYRLSSRTIPTIYQWSMESRTNLLRVESIAYALVANIIDADRLEMFKNLFQLGYTDELVEDIRTLLVRYMSLNQISQVKVKKKKSCNFVI